VPGAGESTTSYLAIGGANEREAHNLFGVAQ
jgi:hypothetical protein